MVWEKTPSLRNQKPCSSQFVPQIRHLDFLAPTGTVVAFALIQVAIDHLFPRVKSRASLSADATNQKIFLTRC